MAEVEEGAEMTAGRAESPAELRQQGINPQRGLSAGREEQGGTDEVLGIIASAPTELQSVLDAIVSSAVRLCDADSVVIQQLVGDGLAYLAWSGEFWRANLELVIPATRDTVSGRALGERRTIQVADL